MKKLTGLVIILAVLVLGGYYVMGGVTEKTFKNNINTVNQSNGMFAEVEQYDRGWFTSNAKVKWRLHVPERIVRDANKQPQTVPAQDYQIETPVIIHHGPFIYANKKVLFGLGYAESDVTLPEKYSEEFDSKFVKGSVKPELDLSLFVNYFNKSTVGISVPKFKLIDKNGKAQFDWMGMNSTTSMSSGMGKVQGDWEIHGVQLDTDGTKITLSKIFSDYDLHQTSAGLFLGDATFTLPAFEVMVKDQKMVDLKEFKVDSESDIKKDLFNMHINLSLKSISISGKTYGPGDFKLALRNIDAESLAKINQQASAMQNGSEADRQRAMLSMLPELPKLFSKGAEFEISDLSVKLPQGTVEGNLLVGLAKTDSTNPFELMQKVKGNAKLKVPTAVVKQLMQQSVLQQLANQPEMQKALVQQLQSTSAQATQPAPTQDQLAAMQTDKQLAALEQTGLILTQGSDYLIEVSLEQGKFTVNGKPFDPSMVKF